MRYEVFFNVVTDNHWDIKHIPYQKRPKVLPKILSKEEINSLLSVITNKKHLAIVATLYGCGLRLSECLCLKIEDIDSANKAIIVCKGKGKKDRRTMLPQKLHEILRSYYRSCRKKPTLYLFPSYNNDSILSERSVQVFIRKYGIIAGITKPVYPHLLRHSFATHLVDEGTPLHKIQKILGHGSLRSTSLYLHLTKEFVKEVRSPLDTLKV